MTISITSAARGAVLAAVLAAPAGCSLGIGAGEYGCAGLPRGVRCLSAPEVYRQRRALAAAAADPGAARDGEEKAGAAPARTGAGAPVPAGDEEPREIFRTRGDVMITWITPYEDAAGNLRGETAIWTDLGNGAWGAAPAGGFRREAGEGAGGPAAPAAPWREETASGGNRPAAAR